MNFGREVKAINERIITDEMLMGIMRAYVEANADDADEVEYKDACLKLAEIKNTDIGGVVAETEELCCENVKYAIRFAFNRGVYACYRQFFEGNTTETPYGDYAEEKIFVMPDMVLQGEFYNRRMAINDNFERLRAIAAEKYGDFIDAIESAWGERENGGLKYGFYLGYRYAADSLMEIDRAANYTKLTNMLLLVEHELGFTQSLAERERLHDNIKPGAYEC